MILWILQHLLLTIGAVAAAGLLVVIYAAMGVGLSEDIKWCVRHIIQSRKDAKLFHQIEEFRRDFS